jgi:hypothetical protein
MGGKMTDKTTLVVLIVSMIGIIGAIMMSGCTVKLVHNPINYNQIDKDRYQIIESYKQGLFDMRDAVEQEKQQNQPDVLPWEVQ